MPKQKIKENQGYSFEVIRNPLITEKSMKLAEENKIIFKIASFANKKDVSQAIESLFKIKPISINILIQKGKAKIFKGRKGNRSNVKKAIVTFKKGQNIDLGAGV